MVNCSSRCRAMVFRRMGSWRSDDVCDDVATPPGSTWHARAAGAAVVLSTSASGRRHGDMRVYGDRQRMIYLFAACATYYAALSISREDGLFAAFLWLRNRFTRDMLAGARIRCIVCVSCYTAALATCERRRPGMWAIDAPLVWLGLAGASVILDRYWKALNEPSPLDSWRQIMAFQPWFSGATPTTICCA